MSPTGIGWTDETWNPTVGCSHVSPGCDHCYAVDVAKRGMQPAHVGLTVRRGVGRRTDWTGKVRLLPDRLDTPHYWKRPRRVFVDSMSDLFHPNIPLEFLSRIWDVMVATPQHTYQVLTKRPQRMARALGPDGIGFYAAEGPVPCPQRNVWLGTSIELDRYSFRADHLRAAPAAVRFLSLEPLLGPLPSLDLTGIDWIIAGGESGPGARPMHPAWVRDLRDRCTDVEIPFFFKQWGAWTPTPDDYAAPAEWVEPDGRATPTEAAGAEPSPDAALMYRVGAKAAGFELDHRAWREFPAAAR